MKTGLFVVSLIAIGSSAFAQPPQAGQQLTISTGVQRWYATVKNESDVGRRENAGGRLRCQAKHNA
jgi:hypothetical protein